jgi:hypothetical protein
MHASKIIPNHSKIIESNMRELQTTGAFAYRKDIWPRRLKPHIDLDVTTMR